MNGIADVAAAGGGAAVGGGSGTTVLNATGMASSVERNNLVFLIPVILEVAEVAVTAAETGEAAEGAGTAVLSAVRSLLSAGKSADTVSRLLTDMGLNGDVLVHEAKGGGKTSAPAQTPTKGSASSENGSAAPEPDGENEKNSESDEAIRQMSDTGKLSDPGDKAGELTRAGRALQKHGGRKGSAFPTPKGNPASINSDGQAELENIMNDPGRVIKDGNRFGGKDIIAADGRGARFDANGVFRGFLEP